MEKKVRIGIDLGGTKIEAIALGESGEILHRVRESTPQYDYIATLDKIAALVGDVKSRLGNRAKGLPVGIGTPGTLNSQGLMKNCNSTCLNGQPLLEDLRARLNSPVRMANDADCFCLSEATDGAASGQPIVFGVIVGTGTGAGITVNGQLLKGANGIAGEWGHNPMPYSSARERGQRPCYCGRYGCIETFLSGSGMVRTWQLVTNSLEPGGVNSLEPRGINSPESPSAESGEPITPLAIVKRSEQGERAAKQCIEHYAEHMACALASVINVLDPHVIVLGGGLSKIQSLYHLVPDRWMRYIFSDRVVTQLVSPRHGDSSGVRGAAWLFS